jgi:sporulation protein YlmC with PRC-barrel domain
MNRLIIVATMAAALTGAAYAQETNGVGGPIQVQVLGAIPQGSTTVTDFYKQNVYAPDNMKIGQIKDIVLDKDGTIRGFILGVGDYIGKRRTDSGVAMPFLDEKNIAVPFTAIHATMKNGQRWLTMDADMDKLKSAPGYTYDKAKATWVPA